MTDSVRGEVRWFALEMEKKLKANDHKGGWRTCGAVWLLNRLKDEVRELESAIHRFPFTADQVAAEAADIANYAMMIADNAMRGRKCSECGGIPGQGHRHCSRCWSEEFHVHT